MEILNIEYNTGLLVLKALNSSASRNAASAKLGVSVRQVYHCIKHYSICYDLELNYYFFSDRSIMLNYEKKKNPISKKVLN